MGCNASKINPRTSNKLFGDDSIEEVSYPQTNSIHCKSGKNAANNNNNNNNNNRYCHNAKNAPSALSGITSDSYRFQNPSDPLIVNYQNILGSSTSEIYNWNKGNCDFCISATCNGPYHLVKKMATTTRTDSSTTHNDGKMILFANDSRLPLNRRQIFSLNKSWKGISRHMDTTGVIMFVKLFSSTPKLLPLFRNIVVEGEESKLLISVKDSIELETHAEIVMNTMDEAISNFGDFDKFHQILTSIGYYHYRLQDFRVEYFWLAEEPFLEAVKETLGDRFTTNMENIYKVTIKFILTTLVKGYFMAKEYKG